MATLSFEANVNKTVTVTGAVYNITFPTIPEGLTVSVNEVEVKAGESIEVNENAVIGFNLDINKPILTVNYENLNSITLNNNDIVNGYSQQITEDATINIVGATAIPNVTISGSGISAFTVNSQEFDQNNLPYTFQPKGGVTNQINVTGSESETYNLQINGNRINQCKINNDVVQLPFNTVIDKDINIAVSGEVYQVDLSSIGGAVTTVNGNIVTDGADKYHNIIDITKDTFIAIDGTHKLVISGQDLSAITINGVVIPIESLPATINNNAMQVAMTVSGYAPSEVHISGSYINTITVDGTAIPVNSTGSADFEFSTREENHFITVVGSQPREYNLTFNPNATTIEMNGEKVQGNIQYPISNDVFIEATPLPIPIHVESAPDVQVEINGKLYSTSDFTFNTSGETEIDITTATCNLTIDYGDDSYSLVVPQSVIYLTAPHRDGWIFDSWSSSDTGIGNPKQVKTIVDLQGKNSAHIVCHYQRWLTINKPNNWN